MAKYRYLVREGFHYARNPDFEKPRQAGQPPVQRFLQYPKGSTVESDEDDLHIRFVNKLTQLVDETQPEVLTEARRLAVADLIRDGVYEESDRRFLEGLTEDAFTRIRNRSMELYRRANANPSENRVSSPLGEDVTDQFQQAYDERLRVFVNANGKYQVTQSTDVRKPLNKNALTKDSVDSFVQQWLKEKGE